MQRRVGDVQKWKGMNADEAEAYIRKRNAANAAKNPKKKRNLVAEERRIRQVREGNERAEGRYRAQQQLEANRPFNRLGKIYPNQESAPAFKQEADPSYQHQHSNCLLYTSPSPRDRTRSRMPSSA